VILCSRPAFPARSRLAAALLHAGLTDIVQLPAGRVVLTAGRVAYRTEPPAASAPPVHDESEQADEMPAISGVHLPTP
jgi:hypothetical protein